MENWQDVTSQQFKLLTGRLNELLSGGLELLRSELGVDLGLEPDLIPPWVVLLAACIGLALMVALWASTCRTLFKKRPAKAPGDDFTEIKPAGSKSVIKPDEQKKKKKKADKKALAAQPNGRAVAEPQEEAIVKEEIVPHHQPPPPEGKAEKVSEVKKSKKKAKQGTKETKILTTDGKEPEEGTWETKVSNKEKREQRKKDKTSSDGSASPGGDNTKNTPPEQPKVGAAAAPVGQKKKKANNIEVAVVVPGDLTGMAVKAPSHSVVKDRSHWSANPEPASLWGTEIDGSWTVIESGMKTSDLNMVTFSGLGVGASESKPISDLPWLSQTRVDDEWSGLSGGAVDPSSDWNAPSEAWGNYEEPTPEPPAPREESLPEPAKTNLLIKTADEDEEEKDKMETAADGATKTKKKRKKKKKTAEEGGIPGQDGYEPEKVAVVPEPQMKKQQQPVQESPPAAKPIKAAAVEARVERSVKDNASPKLPVTQVPQKPADGEPAAKQNNLPAPIQQKKSEESQAPKPAKKKKARRET
ncbi:protein LYRIC-like isoform X2 [Lampris incognitus]|uniref:protein LYRIC-like isoform X2 n=1 Tax=Lampris incognitus TaxID=2546036 RepID=UPI0024B5AA1C|nr:protein LYRIC-like isoform X2 [Lampris incognitus]